MVRVLTEARMKAALQQYLDGFNGEDADSIIDLFADHARIEDPVGGGQIVEGKAAITAFYRRELDTSIRGSHGRSAAIAFTIHLELDGTATLIGQSR